MLEQPPAVARGRQDGDRGGRDPGDVGESGLQAGPDGLEFRPSEAEREREAHVTNGGAAEAPITLAVRETGGAEGAEGVDGTGLLAAAPFTIGVGGATRAHVPSPDKTRVAPARARVRDGASGTGGDLDAVRRARAAGGTREAIAVVGGVALARRDIGQGADGAGGEGRALGGAGGTGGACETVPVVPSVTSTGGGVRRGSSRACGERAPVERAGGTGSTGEAVPVVPGVALAGRGVHSASDQTGRKSAALRRAGGTGGTHKTIPVVARVAGTRPDVRGRSDGAGDRASPTIGAGGTGGAARPIEVVAFETLALGDVGGVVDCGVGLGGTGDAHARPGVGGVPSKATGRAEGRPIGASVVAGGAGETRVRATRSQGGGVLARGTGGA